MNYKKFIQIVYFNLLKSVFPVKLRLLISGEEMLT